MKSTTMTALGSGERNHSIPIYIFQLYKKAVNEDENVAELNLI